jgi:D-glycero-D-manno-heptose 1,7-bisphosphate phosphatase
MTAGGDPPMAQGTGRPRPACFLDRDGTLAEEREYARTADDIVLLPGAAAAVRRLNEAGVAAVVVSNQSGVGRGLFTLADLAAQEARLAELLAAGGARLDGIYACPHAPAAGCACRKPGTALLARAAAELGLDLARSWMVGDRLEDVQTGERAAAGGVLVRTGYGERVLAAGAAGALPPERVAADVLAAVERLLATAWSGGRAG